MALVPLGCLYKLVDDLFKSFNAAGLWISLRSLHGSLKDVTLCTFVCLASVGYQRATVANVNLETESTNINDWLTQTIPEPF